MITQPFYSINYISPNNLIEDGAAILQELNTNYHKAILGMTFIKPLLINNLKNRRGMNIYKIN